MTKEEAVRYLRSSGFSKEQIETVAAAFSPQTAADLISRQAAIDAIEEWGLIDGLSQGQAIEILSDHEKVPSVQPEIIACGEGEITSYFDGIIRCKDCKKDPQRELTGCPMAGMGKRSPEDYCSRAERRPMRLIDADALMKAMHHRAFETDNDTMWQSGCWVRYRAIEQVIKEQPTIEPERKKGHWVEYDPENSLFYCSECFSMPRDKTKFCPRCGAEMKGKVDGRDDTGTEQPDH